MWRRTRTSTNEVCFRCLLHCGLLLFFMAHPRLKQRTLSFGRVGGQPAAKQHKGEQVQSPTSLLCAPEEPEVAVFAPALPNRFLLMVLVQLPLRDVNRAAQVCHQWRMAASNNSFWRSALQKRFPLFPLLRLGKLRPMGLARSLFNAEPVSWSTPLAYAPELGHYGAYA